mmetsp:Transcript_47317/g.153610  ORF Transcript_47317/g.153610 Transcript_47317/m.153610 type:complete len:200 (+) Transcript_47317:1094-1693(+)
MDRPKQALHLALHLPLDQLALQLAARVEHLDVRRSPIALGLAHRLVDLLVLPHACLEVSERHLGVGAAVVVVVHLHPEVVGEDRLVFRDALDKDQPQPSVLLPLPRTPLEHLGSPLDCRVCGVQDTARASAGHCLLLEPLKQLVKAVHRHLLLLSLCRLIARVEEGRVGARQPLLSPQAASVEELSRAAEEVEVADDGF